MAVEEYKALTHINLPFIEERYAPGDVIPRSAFDAYEEQGNAVLGEGAVSADDCIAEFTEWGSISEDPDAEIHPQNTIPDPNRPSLSAMEAQAEALIQELEDRGETVPAKLRAFAEILDKQITAAEQGLGGGEVTNG